MIRVRSRANEHMNLDGVREQKGVGGMKKNLKAIWPKSTPKMQIRCNQDEVSNKHSSRGMRGGKAATSAYSPSSRYGRETEREERRKQQRREKISGGRGRRRNMERRRRKVGITPRIERAEATYKEKFDSGVQ